MSIRNWFEENFGAIRHRSINIPNFCAIKRIGDTSEFLRFEMKDGKALFFKSNDGIVWVKV